MVNSVPVHIENQLCLEIPFGPQSKKMSKGAGKMIWRVTDLAALLEDVNFSA